MKDAQQGPWFDEKPCALCGHSSTLQASHIIPKFVGKWLKDTSLTGFLAQNIDNKIKRVQDLPTAPLLCRDCEQLFSKFEKYFADKVFYPFHNDKVSSIEYDQHKLELFAVSLGWRLLIQEYESLKSNRPTFSKQTKLAESTWREFLLGDRQTVHPYENHLTISVQFDNNMNGIHEKINKYLDRSVDGTVVTSNTRMFTYAKLVHMIFISPIQPTVLNGWKGTRIDQNGCIRSPHKIHDPVYWEFLLDRAKIPFASDVSQPSDKTWQKRLQKAYNNDPKRYLESENIRKITDDMLTRCKQRMDGMPQLVIELVDVIGRQVADTQAETVTNIWHSEKILDALASLPMKEAVKLDSGIHDAINLLFATGRSTLYHLKVNTIWITFIANHYSTKAYQRAVIKREWAKIESSRPNTPVAIFSMNYEHTGVSFESLFMVPPDNPPQTLAYVHN